jgi:hypothetical protein
MELQQADAFGLRLDQQIGVPPGRLGRVRAAEQQDPGERLSEARRPRRAVAV